MASRLAKPELTAMWHAEEQQQETRHTCGLPLYTQPNPQHLAMTMLRL